MSLLGNRQITVGDTRRYEVDYCGFLQQGDVLSATTVTDNGATSTTTSAALDVTSTKVFFLVTAGTLGEVFTVAIQVTTVFGEIVNDTIAFQVVSA